MNNKHNSFESLQPFFLIFVMIVSALVGNGCSDDEPYRSGPVYDPQPLPGNTTPDETETDTPTANSGGDVCQTVPEWIDLRALDCSYNMLGALVRTHNERQFETSSWPFNFGGGDKGMGSMLSRPDDNTCGPVLVASAAIGPVVHTVSEPVEWYLVDASRFDISYQRRFGYAPRSYQEYMEYDALDHMQKLWDCAFGENCELPQIDAGAVRQLPRGSQFTTQQGVCELTLVLLRG